MRPCPAQKPPTSPPNRARIYQECCFRGSVAAARAMGGQAEQLTSNPTRVARGAFPGTLSHRHAA
eukprot:4158490-Pyramimonas_sp.AAC.1